MRTIGLMLGLAAATVASAAGSARALSAIEREGDAPIVKLAATGTQVYECRAAQGGSPQWVFREPKATLSSGGKPVGRHFAGPTWEYVDGGQVVGKVEASLKAPSATDIPWLRLTVASRTGDGVLTPATAVQRIDTHGGTLSGACPEVGAVQEVPYTADYVFLRARP